MVSTTTDVFFQRWAIDDSVIRLRRWATDVVYPLRDEHPDRLMIGTAATCAIRVHDPSRRTSREHAYLERVHVHERQRWCLFDRSKNGLTVNGEQRERCLLSPGMEIELGDGLILIAESARSILLRDALARMLGWSAASAESVDLALRMVRLAALRQAILVLCGESDLAPLAEELHRLTLTSARPFVLCNSRRRAGEDEESLTRYAPDGRTAVAQATGGTVCIYDDRRSPPDLDELLRAIRRPACRAQLVVCARNARKAAVFHAAPIVIPGLGARQADLERIIEEYEVDAARRLGIEPLELSPAERAWVRERSSATLPDIQTATLRLVAIRHAGTASAGAALLGLSHVSMLRWLEKRRFPEVLRHQRPAAGPKRHRRWRT
jgi:hypothetical protein